jgi:hypothetical protein
LAIDAAEQGLELIGQEWAILLARQFLDNPDFRAACPREPVKLSRYDWIIFPPPHLISAPFTTVPRVVNLPPVRIDTRIGAWLPPRRRGPPRKAELLDRDHAGELQRHADPAFLAGLMVVAQAMVDRGQKLNAVLRGLADELAPAPDQRDAVEVQLGRAWNRHRARLRRQHQTLSQRSAEKPRRYRTR